ncbi:MAG: sel1 repeat family protein [Rhodospirillaceae bacterium]|nr:sel1 repeat family protein [Rhodospirillaceae bacterium]MBT5195272.1 sel1 repeat family protein [Rhodospirillaceae bacterium]MBT5898277.1 sel1 repeat family protein [Rhodospirillaceae bacterium]MBT7758491.1 sel1 repeat family protein [Rhodospirillaceae bacterium]
MRRPAYIALVLSLLAGSICLLITPARADFTDAVVAYDFGKFGPARTEFLTLAELGHAGAEFMLGAMYFYGKGVQRNDALAAIWFHKAAIKGNASGQLAFGSLHIRGLGVRQDLVKAYGWLSVASHHAIPGLQQQATALRDEAARLMRPDEIADAQRWASDFKPKPSGLTLK